MNHCKPQEREAKEKAIPLTYILGNTQWKIGGRYDAGDERVIQ